MNLPGREQGNWSWRYRPEQFGDWIAPALKEMAENYARVPAEEPEDTPYRQSTTEHEEEE